MASKRGKPSEDVNERGNDRISELPDSMIHHILSFLPTKQVVQTCILSSRWKPIWRSIPYLDFHHNSFSDFLHYNRFITFSLLFHDDCEIQKLKITWGHRTASCLSQVNFFLSSVIKRGLQVLDIDLMRLRNYPFRLECRFLTCTSLRVLKLNLNSFHIKFPNSIRLPMLRVLHLVGIKFQNDRIGALISQCPLLETLIIERCDFECVNCLNIANHQISYLTLVGWLPPSTTISTPCLVTIKFHASAPLLSFTDNPVSLTKADINLRVSESMIPLLRVIQNAQSLILSHFFLQTYAEALKNEIDILEYIRIPFCNLKLLKVNTSFFDGQILVINTLLKNSPKVETLILEKFKRPYSYVAPRQFPDEELWFELMLPHLKSVRIKDFEGSENEVKFVKFLLKHATYLEKLIIVASCPNHKDSEDTRTKMTRIKEELVIHPCASTCLGMSFV